MHVRTARGHTNGMRAGPTASAQRNGRRVGTEAFAAPHKKVTRIRKFPIKTIRTIYRHSNDMAQCAMEHTRYVCAHDNAHSVVLFIATFMHVVCEFVCAQITTTMPMFVWQTHAHMCASPVFTRNDFGSEKAGL